MKIERPVSTLFYPCPAVLVTCVDEKGNPNIITLAWAGVCCSEPPTIAVGIRQGRHSYALIEKSGEFVVNMPTLDIVKQTDYCGGVSGKDHDKFADTRLTPEPGKKVKAPLIKECPVNLECVVKEKVKVGSHDLFLGEVVAVHVEKSLLDENGHINIAKAKPFVYNQGEYWSLGKKLEVK